MIMLLFVLALIMFGIAAIRWGADSTEKLESREWERRSLHTLAEC